ncbi:MAG TPA: (2Fe-2S)-binding protein [Paraburkholderia sp.]
MAQKNDWKQQKDNIDEKDIPVTHTPVSRRRFLRSIGVSGVAVTSSGLFSPVDSEEVSIEPKLDDGNSANEHTVRMKVNDEMREVRVASNAVLLDVLRDQLGLTGTKKGCDHGQCGACTVHVNSIAVNSCLSLAVMHDGDEVTTVEGLERNGRLHPVQEAFWEHDAYQCGYCTSGQMMSAVAVLRDKRIAPDDHSLREAMSGNICRCGAYQNIIAAIQDARGKAGRYT